jgi:predicted Fe-Mo cluster-binding NifX family protein
VKIAISATNPSIDADVNPRFGRCEHFILVDPETMEFEPLENTNISAGGAGISTAQMIANQGAAMVITGSCGPNAYQTLSAAGIEIITGVAGKVKDAIESYKAGKLKPGTQPNVGGHYGMGMNQGVGTGRGMGMGRAMGTGQGMSYQRAPASTSGASQEEEIETLRNQVQTMLQQLREAQHRISELEKEK